MVHNGQRHTSLFAIVVGFQLLLLPFFSGASFKLQLIGFTADTKTYLTICNRSCVLSVVCLLYEAESPFFVVAKSIYDEQPHKSDSLLDQRRRAIGHCRQDDFAHLVR